MASSFFRILTVLTLAVLCSASGCLGGPEDSPEQRVMKQLNGSWHYGGPSGPAATSNGVFFNRSGTYAYGSRSGGGPFSSGTYTVRLLDNETFEITYSAEEGHRVPPDQGRFESWGHLVLQSAAEESDIRNYVRAI
jgi:hypothetical protein